MCREFFTAKGAGEKTTLVLAPLWFDPKRAR
jgi:hypothetical protein